VIAGAALRSHALARGNSSMAPFSQSLRELRAMPLLHAIGVREHRDPVRDVGVCESGRPVPQIAQRGPVPECVHDVVEPGRRMG
jgi:hypothetical protein